MIKIRFSIAVWSEIYDVASAACVVLNDSFEKTIVNENSYGPIDEIIFVAVSVSDDVEENHKFVTQHNGKGVLTDFSSGERRRYVSVGVSLLPKDLVKCSVENFCKLFFLNSKYKLIEKKAMFLKNVDFYALFRDFSLAGEEIISSLDNSFDAS